MIGVGAVIAKPGPLFLRFAPLILFVGLAGQGHAQATPVEENPAPILIGEQRLGLPHDPLDTSGSAESFGVNLCRLVVIAGGSALPAATCTAPAVDLDRATPDLQSDRLRARLSGFVGQPISARMIAELRAALVEHYRAIGKPLVSVVTPPQDITNGVLTLEVIPFRVGQRRSEGNSWTPDGHILGMVRLRPGDEVSTDALIDDLNWLNLNPFRRLSVVFEPGARPGETDLILRSDEQRPALGWVSLSNAGTDTSDRLRLSLGATLANIPRLDHQMSFLATLSGKAIEEPGFARAPAPGYASFAFSYLAPLRYDNGIGQTLNLQASHTISARDLAAPFQSVTRTSQVSLEYAILRGVRRPDIYFGLDFKRQRQDLFFGGGLANQARADIVQAFGGIRGGWQPGDGQMRLTYDLGVVISPGGVTSNNTDAALTNFAGGTATEARYSYATASLDLLHNLAEGRSLQVGFGAQWTGQTLPGSEKFALGGAGSVRGYLTNEASGDRGASVSVQYNLGPSDLSNAGGDLVMRPIVFADWGMVQDIAGGTTRHVAGAGLGADFEIRLGGGNTLTARASLTRAMRPGITTAQGDWTAAFLVSTRF